MTRTMCSGGLEPHFGVLLSAIFQGVSLGNFHQRGKQWKVVEAKLLQIYVHFLCWLYPWPAGMKGDMSNGRNR